MAATMARLDCLQRLGDLLKRNMWYDNTVSSVRQIKHALLSIKLQVPNKDELVTTVKHDLSGQYSLLPSGESLRAHHITLIECLAFGVLHHAEMSPDQSPILHQKTPVHNSCNTDGSLSADITVHEQLISAAGTGQEYLEMLQLTFKGIVGPGKGLQNIFQSMLSTASGCSDVVEVVLKR